MKDRKEPTKDRKEPTKDPASELGSLFAAQDSWIATGAPLGHALHISQPGSVRCITHFSPPLVSWNLCFCFAGPIDHDGDKEQLRVTYLILRVRALHYIHVSPVSLLLALQVLSTAMEGEGGRAEGARKKFALDHTNTEGDAAFEAIKMLALAIVLPQKEVSCVGQLFIYVLLELILSLATLEIHHHLMCIGGTSFSRPTR